jgi:hypothetical protein
VADAVWFEAGEAIEAHRLHQRGERRRQPVPQQPFSGHGEGDLYETHKAVADATIIVNHMEAENHYTLSRAELKAFIEEKGLSSVVLVPDNRSRTRTEVASSSNARGGRRLRERDA